MGYNLRGKLGLGLAVGCAVAACVVSAAMVSRRVKRKRRWKKAVEILEELEEGCSTPVEKLRQVVDAMAVEMHAGLASEGGSKLKMLLTFVHKLPNRSDKGTYYALDLGGSKLRVLRVQLDGQRSTLEHDVERIPLPQHIMTGTSEELFNFIACALKEFAEREGDSPYNSSGNTRVLGVTFSFPVKQTSISSGILIKWTKGFAIKDMVGKNVSDCLHEAMSKMDLDMRVAVLINDTVGTLALSNYHDEDTVAAVIFGTGTNACYLERSDAIIKYQGFLTTSGGMVVNTEWGNFWSSHLPRTSYDIELDSDSPNPTDQGFEKMISGMYLGEIVRRVLLRMSEEVGVFGATTSKLSVPFVLRTYVVGIMHEDVSPDLHEVSRMLKEVFDISDTALEVRKLIVKVCDVVIRRAARLAAAGIVGILKKIGRDGTGGSAVAGKSKLGDETKMRRTVIAVDGGVYTTYSMFREYLNEAISDILGEDVASHVVLKVVEDGSGIGAALLAASHAPFKS
ncbi:kinase [Lithospermum erythrorhizon]|uniref:Phosphotransferase n=1 Tax=Lithospermum erythrorhizon TaxID=34254 RepID=A0AAV3NUF6_LITER